MQVDVGCNWRSHMAKLPGLAPAVDQRINHRDARVLQLIPRGPFQ